MGSGFSKRKKEARALQSHIAQLQSQMADAEATGSAGNGLVTITLNGKHELKQIKIKPECVDPEDIEGLEDLVKAAYSDALKKIEGQAEGGMQGLAQMPGIPGMPSLGDLEKLKNLF